MIHDTSSEKYTRHKYENTTNTNMYNKAVNTCTKINRKSFGQKRQHFPPCIFVVLVHLKFLKPAMLLMLFHRVPSNHHYQQPRKYFLLLNFPSGPEAGPALAVCHESLPPPPQHNHPSFASCSLQLSGKLNFIILCSHR